LDAVKQAWEKPLQATDPIGRLHIKLSRTAKALNQLKKTCIDNIKMKLAIAKETIWLPHQAQERRNLSNAEVDVCGRIKEIYLGRLAMEKIRARQRARLTNAKFGDVSSKLFYLSANGRKSKKHIQFL
jgi:Zn-finger nucleic acid-binding protein